MIGRDIIVVGASAGGVDALSRLVAQLPADLNAAVLIVLHIGAGASHLADILNRAGKLPVSHPDDGEALLHGRIYVAPPDRHMMVEDGRIRLVPGPKENFCRPAIDPLFRSAALAYGERVIGVMLTGQLDDGSAGLLAIKDRGGIAIVQDPREAVAPSMPESAAACTPVDHLCPLAEIGALLVYYDPPDDPPPPSPGGSDPKNKAGATEAFVAGEEELAQLGTPSPLTCPECRGVLYRLKDSRLLRFRCRAGHVMSGRTLLAAMGPAREGATWSLIRALSEEAWLLRELEPGEKERINRLLEQAEMLRGSLGMDSRSAD